MPAAIVRLPTGSHIKLGMECHRIAFADRLDIDWKRASGVRPLRHAEWHEHVVAFAVPELYRQREAVVATSGIQREGLAGEFENEAALVLVGVAGVRTIALDEKFHPGIAQLALRHERAHHGQRNERLRRVAFSRQALDQTPRDRGIHHRRHTRTHVLSADRPTMRTGDGFAQHPCPGTLRQQAGHHRLRGNLVVLDGIADRYDITLLIGADDGLAKIAATPHGLRDKFAQRSIQRAAVVVKAESRIAADAAEIHRPLDVAAVGQNAAFQVFAKFGIGDVHVGAHPRPVTLHHAEREHATGGEPGELIAVKNVIMLPGVELDGADGFLRQSAQKEVTPEVGEAFTRQIENAGDFVGAQALHETAVLEGAAGKTAYKTIVPIVAHTDAQGVARSQAQQTLVFQKMSGNGGIETVIEDE